MRPSPIPVFSRQMVDWTLDLVLELKVVAGYTNLHRKLVFTGGGVWWWSNFSTSDHAAGCGSALCFCFRHERWHHGPDDVAGNAAAGRMTTQNT